MLDYEWSMVDDVWWMMDEAWIIINESIEKRIQIHIHMYVCMYACMHACMYVCIYLCMYVRGGSENLSRQYDGVWAMVTEWLLVRFYRLFFRMRLIQVISHKRFCWFAGPRRFHNFSTGIGASLTVAMAQIVWHWKMSKSIGKTLIFRTP